MKGINTPRASPGPRRLCLLFHPKGEVWILTLPALARESDHCMVPFLLLRLAIRTVTNFTCFGHNVNSNTMIQPI